MKYYILPIVCVCAVVFTIAVMAYQLDKPRSKEVLAQQMSDIVYYKDTRLNICFASRGYNNGLVIVPCSPELDKFVVLFPVPTK